MKQVNQSRSSRREGIGLSNVREWRSATMAGESRVINRQRLPGPVRCACLWPDTYASGMASLGFLWLFDRMNVDNEISAERFFAESMLWPIGQSPLSLETGSPLQQFDIIAVSISYELNLVTLIRMLTDAGLPALARERDQDHPVVVIGGPLTSAAPAAVFPFADVMCVGDGLNASDRVVSWLAGHHGGLRSRLTSLDDGSTPGLLVGSGEHDFSNLALACCDDLPLRAPMWSRGSALGELLLVEVSRGCPHRCAFCSGSGLVRPVRFADPLSLCGRIPERVPGVGLVGAAVSHWPGLIPTLEDLVSNGKQVGVSSLRADRVNPELGRLLRSGGVGTLTVAADGLSERQRLAMGKGITGHHLIEAAEVGASCGFGHLKVYQMVGLPNETRDDEAEWVELCLRLAEILPVQVTLSPFVPKRFTALAEASFAGRKVIEERISRIRAATGSKVQLSAAQVREASVEALVNSLEGLSAERLVEVARLGGGLGAYRGVYPEFGWK